MTLLLRRTAILGPLRGSFAATGTPAPLLPTSISITAENGSPIGTQEADVAFNIKLVVRDQNGDQYPYNSTAVISSTGSLSAGEGTTANFTSGVLVHEVAFDEAGTGLTISAEVTGGGASGESNAFQVTVPAPATPEPPGYTLWREHTGSTIAPTNWSSSGSHLFIVSDGGAPVSPSSVLRVRYPNAFGGGDAPSQFWPTGPVSKKKWYLEYAMQMSSNFQLHPSATNKLIHFFIEGVNRVFLYAFGSGGATPKVYIGLQNIALPYPTSKFVNLAPNLGQSGNIAKGSWHRIAIHATANTPGVADGRMEAWLYSGGAWVKIHDHLNIGFGSASYNGLWDGMNHSSTWGGTGSTTTEEFSLFSDHIRITRSAT